MNKKYKQNFLRAGALAKEVRAYGKSLVVKGASYADVYAKIVAKIVSLGAIPAFPPQLSLNDVAAHFLIEPGADIIFSDQIVKLDVGVCVEGAIGDCAVSIDLSGKHQKLIDAAEAALLAAEKSIHIGQKVADIGKIIEQTIMSYGFQPVRNLSGHGLGVYKIHMPPNIPNYADNSTAVITPGMTCAIEPFATTGKGFIHELGEPTIFAFEALAAPRTSHGRHLLAKIRQFQGLPFSLHELVDTKIPLEEIKMGLSELIGVGAITAYAPLVEQTHGMVAQAENSILVDEEGQVVITTR